MAGRNEVLSRNRGNGTTPDLAELAGRIAELERMQATTLKILSRWFVRSAPGLTSATFAQILVDELRVATHEEVQAFVAWLTAHPAGG